MKTIEQLGNISGKTALVRCDFNVPLDGDKISDDGRIKAALPTLKLLMEKGVKLVIMAHLGRPKGEVNPAYSLAPVALRLSELTGKEVILASDTSGDGATKATKDQTCDQIVLLENVRFDKRETSKDEAERQEFASELARFGDVYVSDGFGVVHRKQASVYDIAKLLPCAAGLLVQKEIESLSKACTSPQRPLTVILGGAKVSDKLAVIERLLQVADKLIIGGGMAYTFLAGCGISVGNSLLDKDMIDTCQEYLKTAKDKGVQIYLPQDVIVASELDANAEASELDLAGGIPDNLQGLDIGPKTREKFKEVITQSKTVIWNGPMGVFEIDKFANGTKSVINSCIEAHEQGDTFTVVGGGDSASAIRKFGFDESKFSHISTGGGASLEFLEGKELPGVAVLS